MTDCSLIVPFEGDVPDEIEKILLVDFSSAVWLYTTSFLLLLLQRECSSKLVLSLIVWRYDTDDSAKRLRLEDQGSEVSQSQDWKGAIFSIHTIIIITL
jgi:hypothetical protein